MPDVLKRLRQSPVIALSPLFLSQLHQRPLQGQDAYFEVVLLSMQAELCDSSRRH